MKCVEMTALRLQQGRCERVAAQVEYFSRSVPACRTSPCGCDFTSYCQQLNLRSEVQFGAGFLRFPLGNPV